jgi:hypothetical protein
MSQKKPLNKKWTPIWPHQKRFKRQMHFAHLRERRHAIRRFLLQLKLNVWFFLPFIPLSFASPWCASSSRNYFIIEYIIIIITCVYWKERKRITSHRSNYIKCTFRGLQRFSFETHR